jgi:hypothetical protein
MKLDAELEQWRASVPKELKSGNAKYIVRTDVNCLQTIVLQLSLKDKETEVDRRQASCSYLCHSDSEQGGIFYPPPPFISNKKIFIIYLLSIFTL